MPDSASRSEGPKIQRYELVDNGVAYSSYREMERDADGDWVRWDDVSEQLARVPAMEKVVEALEGIIPHLPDLDSAPPTTKVRHIEATRAVHEALALLQDNGGA